MTNFMESLKNEALNEEYNVAYSENGARGFATTGKSLLDFSFHLSNFRAANELKIQNEFEKAWLEMPEYALKYLFYAGDIREGMGERKVFKTCLKHLANNYPEKIKNIIDLIPEYTRWDYVLTLLFTPYKDQVVNMIRDQINEDYRRMEENKPISLCAKWLPSINATSYETKAKAKFLCKELGLTHKKYRQTLSELRRYLKVTETFMTSNRWSEIDYNICTSKNNLLYNPAFLRHDEERRRAYLAAVAKKDGSANMNAGVNFLYEIVNKYMSNNGWGWSAHVGSYNQNLELMWDELLTKIPDELGDMIVVSDGSGSMMSNKLPNSKASCLDVALSFAIATASKLKGPYKDKFITFSERPQFVDLSGKKTLRDKLAYATQFNEVANTNIEKVFDLLLSTATKNKLSQNEIPKSILVVSDMQFDEGTTRTRKTLFREIAEKWADAGYVLPKLIFLNCSSRYNDSSKFIPCTQNEMGVTLLSGFSSAIYNMICNNEADPWLCLKKELDKPRYEAITLSE
jgi:hypothetical protein